MTIIDANTVSVHATYDEPTTSQDGTLLTDLAFTEVEYQLDGAPAEVLEPKQNATSPAGGGHIAVDFILPVAQGTKHTFIFRVFAQDTAGNRLPDASLTAVTVILDRIAPSAITNFIIG